MPLTQFYDAQLNYGSGSKINADDIPDGNIHFFLTKELQVIEGPKTFLNHFQISGSLFVTKDILINADGPDADSRIYFYEDSSQSGSYILWDSTTAPRRFDFSHSLIATHILSRGNLFLNFDGPEGAAGIYFYDGVSETDESLVWNNTDDRFVFSNDLYVSRHIDALGDIRAGDDLYINSDGPDGDGYLYFYETDLKGRYLKWDDADNRFEFNDQLSMTSNKIVNVADPTDNQDVATKKYVDDQVPNLQDVCNVGNCTDTDIRCQNLWINYDGPNQNAFVYFYRNFAEERYLKWDWTYGRFEFNDNLLVKDLFANDEIFVNFNGPEGDAYINFFDNGNAKERYLRWSDDPGRFHFNADLEVDDLRLNGNIFVRHAEPGQNSFVYFHDGNSANGAYLKWYYLVKSFVMSHPLYVIGKITCNALGLHETEVPATTGDEAKLFYDSSDGRLKVKFGDGTVKKIVLED